jgi:hypothetical protein
VFVSGDVAYVADCGSGLQCIKISYYSWEDTTAPTNPTSPCSQTVGSTTSSTWQSTVSDPAFTWSGASDTQSGVAGYYLYWGTNNTGTSTTFQAGTTYDPSAVASGTTHYLRIMARDVAGNNASSWITLYEFLYDGTAPTNPTSPCSQTVGSTTTGTWQSTVSDPAFTWSSASDTQSGVAGYYLYWGTNNTGTSTTFQAGTTYDPSAVASGTTHYLRIMARDVAGNNASSWITLYEFRYEVATPTTTIEGFDPWLSLVLIATTGAAIGSARNPTGFKKGSSGEACASTC